MPEISEPEPTFSSKLELVLLSDTGVGVGVEDGLRRFKLESSLSKTLFAVEDYYTGPENAGVGVGPEFLLFIVDKAGIDITMPFPDLLEMRDHLQQHLYLISDTALLLFTWLQNANMLARCGWQWWQQRGLDSVQGLVLPTAWLKEVRDWRNSQLPFTSTSAPRPTFMQVNWLAGFSLWQRQHSKFVYCSLPSWFSTTKAAHSNLAGPASLNTTLTASYVAESVAGLPQPLGEIPEAINRFLVMDHSENWFKKLPHKRARQQPKSPGYQRSNVANINGDAH